MYKCTRTPKIYKVENCVKNDEIRACSKPRFPVFENTEKYGYDYDHKIMIKNANFFVLIVSRLRTHQRKKFTMCDTIMTIYGKIRIRESTYLGIFHAVEIFVTAESR